MLFPFLAGVRAHHASQKHLTGLDMALNTVRSELNMMKYTTIRTRVNRPRVYTLTLPWQPYLQRRSINTPSPWAKRDPSESWTLTSSCLAATDKCSKISLAPNPPAARL